MKKNYITILAAFLLGVTAKSQQFVGFEDLTLATDTFWNGSDLSGQFTSNTVIFNNDYAGYWKGGFGYSNMTDITTAGYTNSFSCIKGEGAGNSNNYAVFTNLDTTALTIPVATTYDGFWINNSTYAYLSMKNGDSFAKKFGDSLNSSGTPYPSLGKDWFKLTIKGENNDSVEFYLADFRGPDSTDYIVKDWTYVSLAGLDRSSRKLSFKFSSSDTGTYGVNTPKYFCMDSLAFSRYYVGTNEVEAIKYSAFPNPTSDAITVTFGNQLIAGTAKVIDISGRELSNITFNNNSVKFDFSDKAKGTYFILMTVNNKVYTQKIIKQ
jgi:hypothetical protein